MSKGPTLQESSQQIMVPESFKVKKDLLCNVTAKKIHAETIAISLIKHGIHEKVLTV